MVSHPTQLPLCSSFSAQAAASELLPNPAGALMTPSRLAGSSDKTARSRGRATNTRNRAGTILVARNGSCPPPGKVPVPYMRWLERGWIKGPPIHVGPPPIRGMQTVTKVYDLCWREGSGRHRRLQASRSRSPRADTFGQSCAQRVEERTLGFRADD